MAKNLLDQNQIKYDPNLEGERLQAAGEHELQVCGVLQLEGTYNGNTTTMDCLVTPDLDNEAIVSATDAEAVGAITRNRAETNQPTLTSKHVVQKCKKKKRVRFSTEGEEPLPKEPALGDAPNDQREAPEVPSTASSNASTTNTDMFARAYNNTVDPNHPLRRKLSPEEARFRAKIKLLIETYSCLSDTLPDEPMEGPDMVINLKDFTGRLPKKAFKHIPMPLHFKIPGNEEINRLIREGIIKQIHHSASGPFCARAFFVIKPGSKEGEEIKLRLVTDFSEVNKLVIRPVHPFTPGPELLKAIPHTAKFFAKVDFLKGFYQIPLSECSQQATAFICERGTFVYLRAPMGLNASGDEFCRRSDDALAGLTGIVKLIDDVLIFGDTEDQLYERLEAVIHRCQ